MTATSDQPTAGPYVSAKGGAVICGCGLLGLRVGASAGYDFGYGRAAMEAAYNRTGAMTTMHLIAGGYYDFETGSSWNPYVGLGLGLYIEKSIVLPSLRGTAGVTWKATENLRLDIGLGGYTVLTVPAFISIGLGARYQL